VKAAYAPTTARAERAVDLLLSAMEGLKLRAQYEPHLCQPGSDREIVAQLKQVLATLK
jgi:hypothetical protein